MPPPGEPLWIFGYGSLMWNPGFPWAERRVVRVFGYRRRLCIASARYRGTPERPGLVLGLDHGGSCWGMAMRVNDDTANAALAYLWGREMNSGSYRPVRLRGFSRTGEAPVPVVAFVAARDGGTYCGGVTDDAATARIAACCGESGSNLDYLVQTVAQLDAIGLPDRGLADILSRVRAVQVHSD